MRLLYTNGSACTFLALYFGAAFTTNTAHAAFN